MDHAQLINDLESAIKVWRSEQGSDNHPTSAKTLKGNGSKSVLAAARGLVTALQGPRNIVVELSKAV